MTATPAYEAAVAVVASPMLLVIMLEYICAVVPVPAPRAAASAAAEREL
jgi:hypothetical protein